MTFTYIYVISTKEKTTTLCSLSHSLKLDDTGMTVEWPTHDSVVLSNVRSIR